MRTQCPHCSHRFDVPIRAVLAEAARLAEKRKRPVVVNGNVLSPQELEEKRLNNPKNL